MFLETLQIDPYIQGYIISSLSCLKILCFPCLLKRSFVSRLIQLFSKVYNKNSIPTAIEQEQDLLGYVGRSCASSGLFNGFERGRVVAVDH